MKCQMQQENNFRNIELGRRFTQHIWRPWYTKTGTQSKCNSLEVRRPFKASTSAPHHEYSQVLPQEHSFPTEHDFRLTTVLSSRHFSAIGYIRCSLILIPAASPEKTQIFVDGTDARSLNACYFESHIHKQWAIYLATMVSFVTLIVLSKFL